METVFDIAVVFLLVSLQVQLNDIKRKLDDRDKK